jgi:hypothetical protein
VDDPLRGEAFLAAAIAIEDCGNVRIDISANYSRLYRRQGISHVD